MTRTVRTRRMILLGFEGVTALDLVGPSDVFATANTLAPTKTRRQRALYEIEMLGLSKQPFRAESGLRFTPHDSLADARAIDTIIIPGGAGLREPARLTKVSDWLRSNHRRIRRVASVCTGAYAIAEAGLLDGGRATTHWRHAVAFAERYPSVQVDADAIFVREGRIYTSAGITAGIDLALALVEEDYGPALALSIARELVVYLKRAGGQRQYSDRLALSIEPSGGLSALTAWIQNNLTSDLSADTLAQRCHISTRQLSRRFQHALGMSPTTYVELLRTEEASQLLLVDGNDLESVAAAVGFRSADVFRRAFERRFGVTPTHYRGRFQ